MDERSYLVEGSMKLSDINDELGTELDSEDYDSIGGLIIENLDRFPEEGEMIFTEQGIMLQVKEVNQKRIVKVFMTLPEKEKNPEIEENQPEDAQTEANKEVSGEGTEEESGI